MAQESALAKAMDGKELSDKQTKGALSEALEKLGKEGGKLSKLKDNMGNVSDSLIHTGEMQGTVFIASFAEGYLGEEKMDVGPVDLRLAGGVVSAGYGIYNVLTGKGGEHALAVGNGLISTALSRVGRNAGKALAEKRDKKEEAQSSPMSILAMEYLDLGKKWLDTSEDALKTLQENLQSAALMGLADRNPEREALALKDALEVIPYYLHQIYVKLMRAQEGREEDDAWFEENDFPKDSDGSAKVALIGIDSSIVAWGTMLQHLPQQEDQILPILSRLEHLRKLVETSFPAARSFKRPGLDDQ